MHRVSQFQDQPIIALFCSTVIKTYYTLDNTSPPFVITICMQYCLVNTHTLTSGKNDRINRGKVRALTLGEWGGIITNKAK